MRREFLGAALLLAGIAATAQAANASSEGQALYAAVSDSVVYLQHEIRLNSSICKKPALWKRYESLTRRQFLDTGFPLVSGSGFFIDERGYVLTNRHVADFSPEVARYWAIDAMKSSLEKNWGSYFSADDRKAMMADFKFMIEKGRYDFALYAGTKRYVAALLGKAKATEPDLALLKVEGSGFKSLRLAGPEAIEPSLAGTDVYSFGFPLGSGLDAMLEFKERAVTMNRGTVSAIRDNKLSIQHSAAVSHGNSGGPLVDARGFALGLNTASLQEFGGNSLFYAVDAARVHDFVAKLGYGEILVWNRRIPSPLAAASSVKLNALGEIEASSDLLVDADKDVEVVVGGKSLGKGPQFVKLEAPLTKLELHGPSGDFAGKLRLIASLTGSTSIRPTLLQRQARISIASEPVGATVVADGKTLGRTPLEIALEPDGYALSFRQEGLWFADKSLVVRSGEAQRVLAKGESARALSLAGAPPETQAKLRFESSAGQTVYAQGEAIALADGDWKLRVEGSLAFDGAAIPFSVSGSPLSLDLEQYKRKAALQVRGLDPKARVWIDGKPAEAAQGDSLPLSLGVHEVYVWGKGLAPLENTRITVREDGKSFVTWDRLVGHDAKAVRSLWTGLGLGLAGAALSGTGLYYYQNSVMVGITDSYASYVDGKNLAAGAFTAGFGIMVAAIVKELESVKEHRLFAAEEEYRKSMEAME